MFKIKNITLFIVSIALFMDVMDSNVINTAIPAMSHSFQVNPIDLKIALISYLLSLAIFIPMSGWAADKYGVKNIFVGALGLFTIASFFCGYSETLYELVIARFLQGVGGAFMISMGRLIVARQFPRHELVEAMNSVIMVVSIAVMVGPFVGGVIVDYLSWPWIFWVNIPAGMLVFLLSLYFLKDGTAKNPKPFDFIGFILFGGSLALFCFALSEMSEMHQHLESAIMRLLLAVMMLAIFIFYALRKKHPVINIQLFRIRTFRLSIISGLCGRLGFGGMPFLLPLFQQIGFGFSARLAGLLLMPIAFGVIFSKLLAIKILRKIGYKKYLLVNTVFVCICLAMFWWVTADTSIYWIALATFVFGFFISAQYTAVNSLALSDIKDEELSGSNSITTTAQIFSQSLGVAFSAIFLHFYSYFFDKSTSLTIAAFHDTFLSLAVITLLSLFIFMRLRADDGKQMLMKAL